MNGVDILGLAAGTLTTLAFIPQAVRTYKTRHTDDISPVMLVLFIAGIVLWIVYGVLLRSVPVIAANSITLVFILFILAIKLQNLKKHR